MVGPGAKAVGQQYKLDGKGAFYRRRVELFDAYNARQAAALSAAKAAAVPIQVTLPDGKVLAAIKDATTPLDIAVGISKSLAQKVLVAKVDGAVWDLFRPLEASCALQLLSYDDKDGKDTFWHSSAHVLGQAMEMEFDADLTIGPSVDEGFYYDCNLDGRTVSEADFDKIQKRIDKAVSEKQRFERVEVSRNEALDMFTENKFKVEIISNLPQEARVTLYKNGPMVDLCRGPHVPNTSLLKFFSVTRASSAYWRGDAKNAALQRVYAVSFPDKALLADYVYRMEEAKKRDHRTIGTQQELFFFNPLSPGSCFFQPRGAHVYNTLVAFMRAEYWKRGYQEVISPNIYNFDLWKTSGHADHYRENMFAFDIEKQEFGLKPMNCPGHCLMFHQRRWSYRELPVRMADFGVLHRNESSGSLHGLTRVRRFQQDDAHIFCTEHQIQSEVTGVLDLLRSAYDVFGFEYDLVLSTRPDGFIGDVTTWDKAEAALAAALNAFGRPWALNPGDGAFYGPKIDITVFDALKRKFQCGTIQLDFNLPVRFNLTYQTDAVGPADDASAAGPSRAGRDDAASVATTMSMLNRERPVMIHRAILGSVERMIAILCEHYAGKWPLWLSPRQVCVCPVGERQLEYARKVEAVLRGAGLTADVDDTDRKLQKKIRENQLAQYNYILVVGAEEVTEGTVNVRSRDNVVHGKFAIPELLEDLLLERDSHAKSSCLRHTEGAEGAVHASDFTAPVDGKGKK